MKKIKFFLNNEIRVNKESLPPSGISLFEDRLTFRNPLYYRNIHWGKPNPPHIKPALQAFRHDDEKGDLVIARGYLSELIRILHANRYQPELIDETRTFGRLDFDSSLMAENYGIEWPYQMEALEEISKHRFGILVGPFNSGKKMLACKLAARRQVPALVIVKVKRGMYLWKELVKRYLRLIDTDIGLIGDGHRVLGKPFTIGINLTLYKLLHQIEPHTGFVIIDQCDKANLKIFFKAAQFNCPYLLGLANSSQRSDGLTKLMEAYIGQRVYQINPPDSLRQEKPILKIKPTSFEYEYRDDWSEMIKALCQDTERNHLITTDIFQAAAGNRAKILVISERIGHLQEILLQIREAYGPDGEIITGETSDNKRVEIFRRFDMGKLPIILITQKSIHTLDVKQANYLFVASPLKYSDHLTQIVGKLLCINHGDQIPVIYDYQDGPTILRSSLKRRLKVYRLMGAVKE